jgi:hypothetical protein
MQILTHWTILPLYRPHNTKTENFHVKFTTFDEILIWTY